MEISSDLGSIRKNSRAIHGKDLLLSMINRYKLCKYFLPLLFCQINVSYHQAVGRFFVLLVVPETLETYKILNIQIFHPYKHTTCIPR